MGISIWKISLEISSPHWVKIGHDDFIMIHIRNCDMVLYMVVNGNLCKDGDCLQFYRF